MTRRTVGNGGQLRAARFALSLGVFLASVVTAVGLPAPASAVASSTFYVAPWGSDDASGSSDQPLHSLRHAVWRAQSGDAIVLRGGTYRENVQIFGKAIALSSAPGERAVFDGAVELTGWQRSDEDWFVDGWTRQFPQDKTAVVAAENAIAGYPDQVFFNGRPLGQVLTRNGVEPGTFFHDTARDRIYIGDDPAGNRVEASAMDWALYFNDADGSSLTNVTIRRFATPSRQVAALRVHSDRMVISGVTSELNSAAGVSVIGSNVVIRNSRFTDNGHLGVHVHDSDTVVIQNSAIIGNNKSGFDARHSAGGVKITRSTGVTVRHNDVSRNGGPGIWTDLDAQWITVSFNRVETNGRSGIEIELSQNVNVVSNLVDGNGEAGIWVLESQDVQVAHNASYRNTHEISVLEGPRRKISNVSVINNIVGAGFAGRALVDVEDWTRTRTSAEIGVRLENNTPWQTRRLPANGSNKWTEWATRRDVHDALVEADRTGGVVAVGGVAAGGVTGGVVAVGGSAAGGGLAGGDGAAFDWRRPLGVDEGAVGVRQYGSPVSGGLAGELGVTAGTRLRIGPVDVAPSM
jgi:hypothetical protein